MTDYPSLILLFTGSCGVPTTNNRSGGFLPNETSPNLTKLLDSRKTLESFILYHYFITCEQRWHRLANDNTDNGNEGITMSILETKNLKKYYGKDESLVKALDGVNLTVGQGEFVAIVGTSGSGKSTLLHMLGGLDRPDSGTVLVSGKDIFSLKDESLTIFRRRKIGFVFQAYNLVPVINVYENIVLPIELDGDTVDEGYVSTVIGALGLEGKENRMPGQLSGGQQQRVAIARALATKPSILLADEPTGNLDSQTSQDVLSLLKVTGQKFNQTIVMITHNEEIAQMADRIIHIEDGKIMKGDEQIYA